MTVSAPDRKFSVRGLFYSVDIVVIVDLQILPGIVYQIDVFRVRVSDNGSVRQFQSPSAVFVHIVFGHMVAFDKAEIAKAGQLPVIGGKVRHIENIFHRAPTGDASHRKAILYLAGAKQGKPLIAPGGSHRFNQFHQGFTLFRT